MILPDRMDGGRISEGRNGGFPRVWKGRKDGGQTSNDVRVRVRMHVRDTISLYPSVPSFPSRIKPNLLNIGNCIVAMSEGYGDIPEGCRKDAGTMTFALVQERLVEAVLMLWRLPDRERGWLRTGISSIWSLYQPTVGMSAVELAEYRLANADTPPALPGLTRDQVGEMEQALEWMAHVDPADRKLVGLAITQLAQGHHQVSWLCMLAPMGLRTGEDGLRKRYGRAVNRIVVALEMAEIR